MRRIVSAVCVLSVCLLAMPVMSADVTPATHRPIMLMAAECAKTTTTWSVGGTTRYGVAGPLNVDTIDCRKAEEITIYWSLTGNCGSSSNVAVAIEWLLEPPNTIQGGGNLCAADRGYPLSTGWSWIDPATTTTVITTGYRMIQSAVKAPYCRFAMTKRVADDGDNSISARYVLRGRATNRPGGPD